jgi:hypothetical protein
MIYEPKILFNPTNKPVNFMYDRQSYTLAPGEKRNFNGEIAFFILNRINTPLKEYQPVLDDELISSSTVAYDRIPWKELVVMASERGLFSMGMGKDQVIKALIEADEQR